MFLHKFITKNVVIVIQPCFIWSASIRHFLLLVYFLFRFLPPSPPHTRPIMLLDILCSGYDQVFNEYCLNVSNANRVRITVENHRDTCMLLDGDLSIYFDITEEENYFTCYPMFLDGRLEIIPILSYLKMHGCLEKYENNKAAFL